MVHPDDADLDRFDDALRRMQRGEQLLAAARPALPLAGDPQRFRDVEGLPDVTADALDAQLVADALASHGALVVRSVLPDEAVTELRAHLDLTEKVTEQVKSDPTLAAEMLGKIDQLGALATSPAAMETLVRWLHLTGIADVVSRYLGEPAVMLGRRIMLMRRSPAAGLGWHQDGAYFGGRLHALNTWIALTPVGEDRPSVEVLGERIDRLVDIAAEDVEASARQPLVYDTGPELEAALARTSTTEPALRSGDALLFDEMTVHRTGRTEWQARIQECAITWFFAPSRFPEADGPYAL